jgi:hypothetical protein
MINVCRSASTTFAFSGYTGSFTGSPYSNAYDGDLGTYSGYYYIERGGNGYFYNGDYSYWTWTFPARNLTKIAWKLYVYAQATSGASENTAGYGVYIAVTHSGGVTALVDTGNITTGGGGTVYYVDNNNYIENTTGWTGATQIQCRLWGKAKRVDAGAGGGDEWLYHYVYEVEGWGAGSSFATII